MNNFLEFLKSKVFLKQIGFAIGGFILFIILISWWLNIRTNHNQQIEVPNLHKKTISQVAITLEDLGLDFVVIDSASYNPEYPKKSVIEQTPEAGDFVKEKRKIYLTLNPSKYRDIVIPNLNGKTKRQATTHLRSIGFKVGKNYTYVRDIGKDVVRGLRFGGNRIKSGHKLPKNSTIDLVLGDGNGN